MIRDRLTIEFVPNFLHRIDSGVLFQIPRVHLVSGIPKECGDKVPAPAILVLAPAGEIIVSKLLLLRCLLIKHDG